MITTICAIQKKNALGCLNKGGVMQLVKITDKFAIFTDGKRIVAKQLNLMARKILDWNNRNIGANDV